MEEATWWPTGRTRTTLIAAPVGTVVVVALLALAAGRPAVDAVPVAVILGGIVLTVGAAVRGARRGRGESLRDVDRAGAIRQIRGRTAYEPRDLPRLRQVADSYGRSCVDSTLFSLGLVFVTGGLLAIATTTFLRTAAVLGLLVVAGALVATAYDLRRTRRFLGTS